MIEPSNGHAPTTSAEKYTGAIILRTRPHTYKRVVRLLSEGVPAIRIARDCKVTERSVAAIAKREREEITERKKSLAGLMSNIAEIGGANVERKIGKASVRDAIIGTGVAVDKMRLVVRRAARLRVGERFEGIFKRNAGQFAGLRASEARQIVWSDFDFSENFIRVRALVSKTHRPRAIPHTRRAHPCHSK
jgi:hypothetical protein